MCVHMRKPSVQYVLVRHKISYKKKIPQTEEKIKPFGHPRVKSSCVGHIRPQAERSFSTSLLTVITHRAKK